jgi:hypothetical protein
MAVVSDWWVFTLDLNCLANRSVYFVRSAPSGIIPPLRYGVCLIRGLRSLFIGLIYFPVKAIAKRERREKRREEKERVFLLRAFCACFASAMLLAVSAFGLVFVLFFVL